MENYRPDFLKKYVGLIVSTGVNIQQGQTLVITAPVECAYFVRLAAAEAYALGAHDVVINWFDDMCTRERYLNAKEKVFGEYPEWTKIMLNKLTKKGAALLKISASNPEAMKGVDINRVITARKAADKAIKPYTKRVMESRVQWCVVSVPSEAWAKKVFPNTSSSEEAAMYLWDAIYAACRIGGEDAVTDWKNHAAYMRKNMEIMNNYNFKTLRFKNSIGTDFTLDLAEGHIWSGAGDTSKQGIPFFPNIPTEEIFTAPFKTGVNGTVVGSKPFVYNGNVVEQFSFRFENGKVIEVKAHDEGKEIIEKLLKSLKNMDYLGEVALVPHNSPISNMNVLFYNTLYDENASCHLALGEAYPDTVRGGVEMNMRQREKAGLNHAQDHHDFMIGTADMQITGITSEGREVPVFINGNFAM